MVTCLNFSAIWGVVNKGLTLVNYVVKKIKDPLNPAPLLLWDSVEDPVYVFGLRNVLKGSYGYPLAGCSPGAVSLGHKPQS